MSLVTFGADDFLDFIDAYFIEFAMMLFERTYLGNLSQIFFEYIETTIPLFVKHFVKWINHEDKPGEEPMSLFNIFVEFSEDSESDISFSDDNSLVKGANDSDQSSVQMGNSSLLGQSNHNESQDGGSQEMYSAKFRQ